MLHCNTNSVHSAGERSQFWSVSSNSAQPRTDSGPNPALRLQEVLAAAVVLLGKDTTRNQGVSLQRLTACVPLWLYNRAGLDCLCCLHCLPTEPGGKRPRRCPGIRNRGPSSGRPRSTSKRWPSMEGSDLAHECVLVWEEIGLSKVPRTSPTPCSPKAACWVNR